jgi:hypothetical protein
MTEKSTIELVKESVEAVGIPNDAYKFWYHGIQYMDKEEKVNSFILFDEESNRYMFAEFVGGMDFIPEKELTQEECFTHFTKLISDLKSLGVPFTDIDPAFVTLVNHSKDGNLKKAIRVSLDEFRTMSFKGKIEEIAHEVLFKNSDIPVDLFTETEKEFNPVIKNLVSGGVFDPKSPEFRDLCVNMAKSMSEKMHKELDPTKLKESLDKLIPILGESCIGVIRSRGSTDIKKVLEDTKKKIDDFTPEPDV